MGLLEKAQQKKPTEKKQDTKIKKIEPEKKSGLLEKAQAKNQESFKKIDDLEIQDIEKKTKSSGLLEKAKQKESVEEKATEKEEKKVEEKQEETKPIDKEKIELIEEKTGFGWKGLGTRRIVYDHTDNEYLYEVKEPILTEGEIDTKKELSHLFKMLANVNITGLDNEEKEKYLEESLEQIIIDNNVKFGRKKKKPSTDKKTKSSLLKGLKKKKNPKDEQEEPTEDAEVEEKIIEDIEEKTLGKSKFNLKARKVELTEAEKKSKDKVFYHLFKDFLGYGKIDVIMKDEGIEDISCDGHHVPIFIYHKKYDAITSNVIFDGEQELNSFVIRLAQICGKQISIYSPIVDGKLPDGSRLQTTLARTVTKGSTFTIRRFKDNPLTPIDLVKFDSLSTEMAAYFWIGIERGASILFCGGTASGKTTALNALSLFIPAQHKIISIEDTREINLPHKNWIAGTTRQGFSSSNDGKSGKDIDMFDLIRAALRQRPKVVMVGEVRGKEAYSLFQAMATGHTSYATVHASDIHTLIQRLENPPISLPRALLTSLDIIVFQNAVDIGGKTVRRMTSVTEIVKLDTDTNQLIFMEPYRWVSKTDDRFDSSGASKLLNDIKLQNELEKTKQEIEETKRQLELAKMKEKEKEKELKLKSIEKKQTEKQKRVEAKKKLKEEKLKEKLAIKTEKLKQKEQIKLEKQKIIEQKKLEKEQIKLEKQKELEQKKQEKLTSKEVKEKPEKKKEKTSFFKKEKPTVTTIETEKVKVEPAEETFEIDKMIIKKQQTQEPTSKTGQEQTKEPVPKADQDIEKLLPILDSLLEKLPEEVISEFAESDDFNLYEKVMRKYKK